MLICSDIGVKLADLTCKELNSIETVLDVAVSGSCLYLACKHEGVKRLTIN